MSDFLSPAILDVIKEKRMKTITISDFREKLLYLLKGKDTISNVTDLDDLAVYEMIYGKKADAITELFLDTIEKSKPEKQDESVMAAQPIGGRPNFGGAREAAGFNDGVAVFEAALKKEIGK